MRLRDIFVGVAAKTLRSGEADPNVSNQHEFNGINSFRRIFGEQKRRFSTVFLYADDDGDNTAAEGFTTWYDCRADKPDRNAEYRLYFNSTEVSERYSEGDTTIVAIRPDDSLLIVTVPAESSIADQLLWLFQLDDPDGRTSTADETQIDRDIDFSARWILGAIGIEPPVELADADILQERFGSEMPTTRVFSAFAREQAGGGCSAVDDPDHALLTWLETEERFFRAFERSLVENRLRSGFVSSDNAVDVDGFVSFSLSVQNRRKSRAGYALENHLDPILEAWQIRYERGVTTEGKAKPDFLFPGRKQYLDMSFPESSLAILGAKASCKDRWRQVLGEADRIETKHLLTLEPGISANQTDEMQTRSVQLVLPRGVHGSYSADQRSWLWSLADFLNHRREVQQAMTA